jgi:hypothetical protein
MKGIRHAWKQRQWAVKLFNGFHFASALRFLKNDQANRIANTDGGYDGHSPVVWRPDSEEHQQDGQTHRRTEQVVLKPPPHGNNVTPFGCCLMLSVGNEIAS